MNAKANARKAAYHARKPWVRYICWAKRRTTSTDPRWKSHHGKEHTLTASQAEILWKRDGADKMARPSLDRKKATEGYTFENCQFMEWMENVRLPHRAKDQPEGPAPEFY